MNKYIISFILGVTCLNVQAADRCKSWTPTNYPVLVESCSYASGGSGYYKVTNKGNQDAQICWSLTHPDGKTTDGCNSSIKPGKSTTGSCFRCGDKNGGTNKIVIKKYKTTNNTKGEAKLVGTSVTQSQACEAVKASAKNVGIRTGSCKCSKVNDNNKSPWRCSISFDSSEYSTSGYNNLKKLLKEYCSKGSTCNVEEKKVKGGNGVRG